ncbi:glycosyltransferase [Flavobacterium hungaricum]|uniref:Glycosyltransferase family 2 protein n=1 Tax=Flavobacterium hungaricum TaxID=2082725 RepID=A0ABR9TGP7_9FLAO|nr:glycosyltransferase [Flavobacterium hungaricum]MBE8724538.1 glycosyltransferase family 2 protein [Flavobacterium hungaricum]
MNGISVIVCCYNSVSRLKPTIEHLQNQINIAVGQWEILIIDNASTDATFEFANNLWQNSKTADSPNFRVIKEATPGLTAARMCGIKNSSFDFLLFCDDDNWLSNNYLSDALGIINNNPNVGIIGGYGLPVFEGKEPPLFWENQYHTLAVGSQYLQEGNITNTRKVVYGAGMIVNKKAFAELVDEYEFEFQTTGRIGTSLVSSEDHELCLAVGMIGYEVLWYKKLQFYHYIPKSRTEIKYYKKLFLGFGLSSPMLIGYYLDRINPINLKNDYRYIASRNIKKMISIYIKIFYQRIILQKSEYQILHLLQQLYSNLGSFKTTIKVKNRIRDSFLKTRLYKLN